MPPTKKPPYRVDENAGIKLRPDGQYEVTVDVALLVPRATRILPVGTTYEAAVQVRAELREALTGGFLVKGDPTNDLQGNWAVFAWTADGAPVGFVVAPDGSSRWKAQRQAANAALQALVGGRLARCQVVYCGPVLTATVKR